MCLVRVGHGSMSDSLGRSSCELNETFEEDSSEGREWRPPDSELIRRIHTQVESYLSDESLAEDAFLLKHVRRNRMGYVSIKLLTSFKKVRGMKHKYSRTSFSQTALLFKRFL